MYPLAFNFTILISNSLEYQPVFHKKRAALWQPSVK